VGTNCVYDLMDWAQWGFGFKHDEYLCLRIIDYCLMMKIE
jgi:hypothetical protein